MKTHFGSFPVVACRSSAKHLTTTRHGETNRFSPVILVRGKSHTMEHTWLGHSVRRLGRIGIGFVAFVAGFAAFAVVSMINLLVTDAWFWKVCGVIGLVTAVVVFALCDRLGLVPDDSDPPTTLSLSGPSAGRVSPSEDRHDRDPRT
jgi:hypothetical protein